MGESKTETHESFLALVEFDLRRLPVILLFVL